MKYKPMSNCISTRRISVVLACLILSLVVGLPPASAATTITRESILLDELLADQEQNTYGPVEKVAVARVTAPDGVQFGDGQTWMKGLYYYSITKLGFTDIPFNYVVTWQGDVFEGKGGGQDVAPLVGGTVVEGMEHVAVVAYFDNRQEITAAGETGLKNILSELLSRYGLAKDAVVAVDVALAPKTQDIQPAVLQLTKTIDTEWDAKVAHVTESAVISEPTIAPTASVVEVTVPENVTASEHFMVTAKIKNEGTMPWYDAGSHMVLVATSDPRDHDSALYASESWASLNRASPSDSPWVRPGETGIFTFEIATPLIPDDYSEKYELLMMPEYWVEGSQFEVTFTVSKGDFNLVRVKDTETGYLNVRDCPSSGCAEVGKVVPGDVLINLGTQEGWYNVKLGSGVTGWVFGKYIEEI